jgi:hypothetical protein
MMERSENKVLHWLTHNIRARVCGVLVIALTIWLIGGSQSYHDCIRNHKNDDRYRAIHESSPGISAAITRLQLNAYCIGDFADKNGSAITAVATLLIAVFTFTLQRSTDRLWKAGKEALEATERAFVFIDGFDYELSVLADQMNQEELPEALKSVDPRLYVTYFAIQPRWSEIFEMPGMNRVINDGIPGLGGNPMTFVWGRADYEDVFGRPHFTKWCYVLRFERHDGEKLRAHFIQWCDHNSTDASV